MIVSHVIKRGFTANGFPLVSPREKECQYNFNGDLCLCQFRETDHKTSIDDNSFILGSYFRIKAFCKKQIKCKLQNSFILILNVIGLFFEFFEIQKYVMHIYLIGLFEK